MNEQTLPGEMEVVGQSATLGALGAALAKAQGEMTAAKKDRNNPAFGKTSKYADLASSWDACRTALSKNGLAVIQRPSMRAGKACIRTMLLHSSGEWLEGALEVALEKPTAHGLGSALTYLRRFALQATVGVAADDDDGNAASLPAPEEGKIEAPRQQAAKVSKVTAAKEKAQEALASQGGQQKGIWPRIVDLGAMFGKTPDEMKDVAKSALGGKTVGLNDADLLKVRDALVASGRPIVGVPSDDEEAPF